MTLKAEYDIAIVGFGPVGALSAFLLAEAGLRVAVLERSPDPVVLPRAVGLDGESMRAFQRVGMGDEVAAILQPPRERDQVCFTDSQRRILFGVDIPQIGPHGWRDIAFFDQPELEVLLRARATSHPLIDVALGHQVEALEQDDTGVELHGAGTSLRADFVLGCDGASSFVRGAVGIDWLSLGYDQDWLVLDIIQTPEADLPLVTMQVCDPARLTSYICVKDPYRRWEFQLLPGETREELLRPEKIEELLNPWLPPEHYSVRRKAVYQFHAATAGRWREKRVFLAGDAAHQTPPFLGQGLNAGFRDAINLAWKIPLVHAGVCDQSLLDSYGAERDAHARDLVERAVAVGKLMETLAAREAGKPDPYPTGEGPDLAQGLSQPPLRGGVLVAEQTRGDHPVGTIPRQPNIRTADGTQCRLDDLLGRGFSIIGRKQSDLRLGGEAQAVLDRLGGRCVHLEGVEVIDGEMDRLFDAHAAAVLRPDRYLFGVVDDEWDLDRLLVELGRKLALA